VPSGCPVYTHGECIISLARFEFTRIVVSRHVPVAAHNIVDMLAVPSGIRTNASTEAELSSRHEIGPLVVLEGIAEAVTEDKSANRVAVAISTMGVEFSSIILCLDVHLGKIANAGNLYVVWRLDEMNTLERSVGHSPGATTRFCAPSDFVTLGITDGLGRFGGRPQAEVIKIVNPDGLAAGTLGGDGSAVVVA